MHLFVGANIGQHRVVGAQYRVTQSHRRKPPARGPLAQDAAAEPHDAFAYSRAATEEDHDEPSREAEQRVGCRPGVRGRAPEAHWDETGLHRTVAMVEA